ncbi:DUF5789 family protein [Natrononativus amylolyticus]|uniref:DUF5789 family protein n=1 Tax=Natrononativus amylolyticus TaxID=2963434 RepID=UPI0020CE34F9|nr:hypothetical protein [Natrononativus amylolyticus]
MTDPNETPPRREQGVDFGDLEERLAEYSYPVTSNELVETCGDVTLDLPAGTETLRDALGLIDGESYASVAEVRQALFNTVDSKAIGRKYYSDRTPPALGENRRDDQVSF